MDDTKVKDKEEQRQTIRDGPSEKQAHPEPSAPRPVEAQAAQSGARTALGGTRRQAIGQNLVGLGALITMLCFMASVGGWYFAKGTTTVGLGVRTMYWNPGFGLLIFSIAIMAVAATLQKLRAGKARGPIWKRAVRDQGQMFKSSVKECGLSCVFSRRGFKAKVVTIILLSALNGYIWIHSYLGARNAGLTIGGDASLGLVGVLMAVAGSLLLIPVRQRQVEVADDGRVSVLSELPDTDTS